MRPFQYSLKRLFQAMTLFAIPSLVFAWAVQGVMWAQYVGWGVGAACVGLLLVFLVYGLFYLVMVVADRILNDVRPMQPPPIPSGGVPPVSLGGVPPVPQVRPPAPPQGL